jgi:phage shock protein A
MLTRARRAVAGVATSRKRLELQISELERQAGDLADPRRTATDASQDGTDDRGHPARGVAGSLPEMRRQYADLQAREERVVAASRRLTAEVSAFRAGKEAAKAAYTAAERCSRRRAGRGMPLVVEAVAERDVPV